MGEIAKREMAGLISERVGFEVTPAALVAVARSGQITSRVSSGRRVFEPRSVLAEIEAGRWRPHRQGRPRRLCVCANPRCTNGEQGQRVQRLVYQSQLDKLATGGGWTCSRACTDAVMKGRPRDRRTERRQCSCTLESGERCPQWIPITQRRAARGTGPQRCDRCRDAGHPSALMVAQRKRFGEAWAHRWANDPEWRDELSATRSSIGRKVGKRNSTSTSHMDKLADARMSAHAARQQRLVELIQATLRADPMASNLAVARGVGRAMGGRQCAPGRVAYLRRKLEEAGEIPRRAWGDGVLVCHREGCASRDGGNCDCEPRFEAWVYDKQAKRKIRKSFATEADAKTWRAERVPAEPQERPAPNPFKRCKYTDDMRRRTNGKTLSRAQRSVGKGLERSRAKAATEDTVATLWENENMTAEQIAVAAHISRQQVWRIVKARNLPPRRPGPRAKSL